MKNDTTPASGGLNEQNRDNGQPPAIDIAGALPGSRTVAAAEIVGPSGEVAALTAIIIKGATAGSTLLILAGVHGDEYEGIQTAILLARQLAPADIRGTLVIVPVTNRLAYDGISRSTPQDGRNLAREFPGSPTGSITGRLASFIHEQLIRQADFLLDLHSGGTNYALPELVGYYHNDDDPLGRQSRAAAEAFGMGVLWGHRHIAAGRTVSVALASGVPWLYTEGFGGRRIRAEEALHYLQGAYRLMVHLGMLCDASCISGFGPPAAERIRLGGTGDFDYSATAPTSGFFIPEARLLDEIAAGATIGAIYALDGTQLCTVAAEQAGVLVMLAGTPKVDKGGFLYMIVERMQCE